MSVDSEQQWSASSVRGTLYVGCQTREKLGAPGERVCTVHCGSFTIQCMVASSILCKISLCADRAHACAGGSHVSSGIDVACPTTQSVFAIASLHEFQGDSWPSSSTGISFCCNQQYSITAVTTSTGSIAERYAYTAYGQPTILDASASVLSSSAISNRYTYTGREWDATLALYHFRARWMNSVAGRFLGRDPIGYEDGVSLHQLNVNLSSLDPEGLAELDADPSSSKNAPWCYHDFPGSPRTIIQGDTDVSPVTSFVKCRCVCCSDGYCNGTVKKGPLCTVVVRPVIRINRNRTWDKIYVYGHEQYHIDNFLEEARNIAQKLTALESSICTSEKDYGIKAKELENDGNSWLDSASAAESHGRQRPGRHPFPGTKYLPKHRMPDEPQSTCAPASEPKPFEEPKDCLLRKLNVKSQHRLVK